MDLPVNIEIIDSRDDARQVYVVVNTCAVPMAKVKLKDFCYVLKLIGDMCHISIDLKDCEKEPIK